MANNDFLIKSPVLFDKLHDVLMFDGLAADDFTAAGSGPHRSMGSADPRKWPEPGNRRPPPD